MAATNSICQSRTLINITSLYSLLSLEKKKKPLLHQQHPHPPQFEFPHHHNMNINSNSSRAAAIITISATGGSSTAKTSVDSPPPDHHHHHLHLHLPQLQPNNDDNFTNPSPTSSQWSEFAKNVSGEWDGYGAEFSPEGKPFELPESVVPEAYREWEVKVFDWQTQCPTVAESDDFVAKYKLIKVLPTVGCEADAATRHSVDERNIGGADNNVAAFAYQSSGCYVAVWPAKDHETYSLLELEHCLVDPQNRESRVRIIQVVRVENFKLVIQNIKVFVEQWYGPFRNGEQLGGCSIRDTTFASTKALKSSEVSGVWQCLNAVGIFQNSQDKMLQLRKQDNVQKLVRDGSNFVFLPKKLWCSLKEREDGETCCEVGWLLDQGHAVTSKCIFSGNTLLKEIATSHETAALAQ